MHHYRKLTLLALAAACTVAYAGQSSKENDIMAITQAKIPLAQAVSTAEQYAKGKAARAKYENSKHGWLYEVKVVSGAKIFEVKVDADQGTVISSAEDKNDDDDKQD